MVSALDPGSSGLGSSPSQGSGNIKQLLNEVFVISRIIQVEVKDFSRGRRLRLITLTKTLIILDKNRI